MAGGAAGSGRGHGAHLQKERQKRAACQRGWGGFFTGCTDALLGERGEGRGFFFFFGRPARRRAGGADFSPDARTLYWSSGETGAIYLFDVASRKQVAEVLLNSEVGGHKYEDSYAVDVKVSGDGKYLYCADVTNFRVVVVDAVGRRVVGSVAVGRYPYALAVVGQRVYAANIGLFEYSPVPPPGDARFDQRGLTFPPFGYPSKEARDGVQFEGRRIPGLGE